MLSLGHYFRSLTGIVSLYTRPLQLGCLTIHTTQRRNLRLPMWKQALEGPYMRVCEATLVWNTQLPLFSILVFDDACFVNSKLLFFCFNYSLKSRRAGFTQCFWTMKSDQASLILGNNFCTAALRSDQELIKSVLYGNDLKTPENMEMAAE